MTPLVSEALIHDLSEFDPPGIFVLRRSSPGSAEPPPPTNDDGPGEPNAYSTDTLAMTNGSIGVVWDNVEAIF